jgi:hypothetical protein
MVLKNIATIITLFMSDLLTINTMEYTNHIYTWSWLNTNIKELIDSQIDNPLYVLSI